MFKYAVAYPSFAARWVWAIWTIKRANYRLSYIGEYQGWTRAVLQLCQTVRRGMVGNSSTPQYIWNIYITEKSFKTNYWYLQRSIPITRLYPVVSTFYPVAPSLTQLYILDFLRSKVKSSTVGFTKMSHIQWLSFLYAKSKPNKTNLIPWKNLNKIISTHCLPTKTSGCGELGCGVGSALCQESNLWPLTVGLYDLDVAISSLDAN